MFVGQAGHELCEIVVRKSDGKYRIENLDADTWNVIQAFQKQVDADDPNRSPKR